MSADSSFVNPGAAVWLLDRARVRSGAGPQLVTVADVHRPNESIFNFRTQGTRGWYTRVDAFATENEAMLAWFERADAEYQKELARFNGIAQRLLAYQKHRRLA
jgi:hypothetical protein